MSHNTTLKPVLVVMWDPHRPGHSGRPSKGDVEAALFGSQPSSLREFYKNQSNGKVDVVSAGVLDWVDADKPAEHYWSHPKDARDGFSSGHVEKWAEILKKTDQAFDFSAYDKNHDHKLSADELSVLILIPQNAPFGTNRFAEDKGGAPLKLDGVEIGMIAEVYTPAKINDGVVRHELGHKLFGFPDLYDNTYHPANGAKDYSLMDVTYTSAQVDAVLKKQRGWVTQQLVKGPGVFTLKSVETSHEVITIERPHSNPKEYICIERRQRGNYDKELPTTGYVVWRMTEKSDGRRQYRFNFDGELAWDPSRKLPPQLLRWSDNTAAAYMGVDPKQPDSVVIVPFPSL